MERLFVDTSAWFAFVNAADPEHRPVRDVLRTFQGRLVTSNYIFDETVTLCLFRLGHDTAVRVGEALRQPSLTDLVRITVDDEREAWRLFTNRPDKNYSFTDCTSFVLLDRLGLDTAVALDEDFRREGFRLRPE